MTLVSLALFRSPSEKHYTREGDLYKQDTHAGRAHSNPLPRLLGLLGLSSEESVAAKIGGHSSS